MVLNELFEFEYYNITSMCIEVMYEYEYAPIRKMLRRSWSSSFTPQLWPDSVVFEWSRWTIRVPSRVIVNDKTKQIVGRLEIVYCFVYS